MAIAKEKNKSQKRIRRKNRVRAKVSGTATRPRLSVYRSLSHMYAQLIDDVKGVTLAAAKDGDIKDAKATKTEIAGKVGELLAKKALAAGITEAVFDKGSAQYHGRVKAVAEGARKGGLKI
ncbi:MAG: 50S ribosomal protein L18 [Candidatus Buchananbacteria bacterium]|nr:50S ribosomal protein L18 [Candidatus Buchananbacteria bacterium]